MLKQGNISGRLAKSPFTAETPQNAEGAQREYQKTLLFSLCEVSAFCGASAVNLALHF
jgi:hypothetical protein